MTFPLTGRPGPRRLSVWALSRVFGTDGYADRILENAFLRTPLDARDKALCTEIVFGTLRWWKRIDRILEIRFRGDWNRAPEAVRRICETAVYQILFLSKVPAYAAVDEAVNLGAEILHGRWKSVINALLRAVIRGKEDAVDVSGMDDLTALSMLWSHPRWMVENRISRFGRDRAERMCLADNERPGLGLRVNILAAERGAVLSELAGQGIEAEPFPWLDEYLTVRKTGVLTELPAFREGRVTAQDPSAGMAVRLLDPRPGESILDMAAAPGGKTTHAAERAGDQALIVATDVHPGRLRLLSRGVRRLGLHSVSAVASDGAAAVRKPFDKILLDAPCSGMGVVRRRPELKWRRTPEDVSRLTAVQARMLESADRILKPGGVLVYSTCTVTEEENRGVVDAFRSAHPSYRIDDPARFLPEALISGGCAETSTDVHGTDGAFAVRMIKTE
ncbi:16S rRNA (cytosine(967)-C(5))-methyltransferase RsmB [bacterium]|nr:16S rRNA (cytosine(967)-C(5))-methyltransferase RsmB [bacterium]